MFLGQGPASESLRVPNTAEWLRFIIVPPRGGGQPPSSLQRTSLKYRTAATRAGCEHHLNSTSCMSCFRSPQRTNTHIVNSSNITTPRKPTAHTSKLLLTVSRPLKAWTKKIHLGAGSSAQCCHGEDLGRTDLTKAPKNHPSRCLVNRRSTLSGTT